MNKKGQALVEFILILPIFLLLLFAIYDFGMIFSNSNKLENDSLDIINMYQKGMSINEIEEIYSNIIITITEDDKYKEIKISKNIKLITPGLGRVLGNPYEILVKRYIPNE